MSNINDKFVSGKYYCVDNKYGTMFVLRGMNFCGEYVFDVYNVNDIHQHGCVHVSSDSTLSRMTEHNFFDIGV